jgi:hypothetical protein
LPSFELGQREIVLKLSENFPREFGVLRCGAGESLLRPRGGH